MKIRVKQGERLKIPPGPPLSKGGNCFELEANAQLELTRVTFANQDFCQNFEVVFLGEHASCNLIFLDLARNSSNLETNIKVVHQVPNCKSVQVHKGLYHDESTGSLKAFVEVAPHALGTDASQLHRSLLLSPNASSKPEPHLQIGADAVKCRHGVSIGQLDTQALFYLKARGLDEQTAKRFLIQAFAQEILDTVSDKSHREKLEHEVFAWI